MKSIEEVEASMVELCDAAKAKGWKFRACNDDDTSPCGCVLEACASELGLTFNLYGKPLSWDWSLAATRIGVRDAVAFGGLFDATTRAATKQQSDIWAQLGQKMARKYVLGEDV